MRRLKLPLDKAPCDIVAKFGNQSGASIPVTITETLNNKTHDSNLTTILSGFGVGLSWATCLMELNINKIYQSSFFKK